MRSGRRSRLRLGDHHPQLARGRLTRFRVRRFGGSRPLGKRWCLAGRAGAASHGEGVLWGKGQLQTGLRAAHPPPRARAGAAVAASSAWPHVAYYYS